jgi:hypothetical protein
LTNLNPRASIGDNQGVDQAQIVADRLAIDYGQSVENVEQLLADAEKLPTIVDSDNTALLLGATIKQLRDLDTRLESHRESEKQPYLRAGNAVDNFFHSLRDRIVRRRKNDRSVKPGAIDILQDRINIWQDAKIAEEKARLERERLEAARLAREEQARLAKLRLAAEEAERAVARARSEATKLERANEAAAKAEQEALARHQAALASEQAEEARLATLVKPADLSRVRSQDNGVLLTTAREGYAFVTDRAVLDLEALRPFFTDFELDKALRGWAKSTGHVRQLPGAEVGFRNKGVTR